MNTTILYDQLARVSKHFFIQEPFYGFFLLGMKKVFTKELPTAAVGPDKESLGVTLYINPEFWDSLKIEQKYAILKHELLHLILFHVYMLNTKLHEQKKFNIAADIEVNQHIDQTILKSFSAKLIFLEDFVQYLPKENDLNMKGLLWYYNRLNLPEQFVHEDASHDKWGQFSDLGEAEKDIIKSKIEHTIAEAYNNISEKDRGSLPGSVKELVEKMLMNKQFFNWKSYLKNFIGGSTETYTKRSRYKPSKRFDDAASIKVKFRKKVLVAIDTSGSVSSPELTEFLSVIHTIHNNGNHVDIIQCDTQLAEQVIPYKRNLQELMIFGRGGTTFDPPIEYLNKHARDYCSLIYFTDGEAPCPKIKPAKPVLWVLSPQCHTTAESMNEKFFGKTIKIPK